MEKGFILIVAVILAGCKESACTGNSKGGSRECFYRGKWYKSGADIPSGDCQECTCQSGFRSCIQLSCGDGTDGQEEGGQSTDSQQEEGGQSTDGQQEEGGQSTDGQQEEGGQSETCNHKGETYEVGDRFDCDRCTCVTGGHVRCNRRRCKKRRGCQYMGKSYRFGSRIMNGCKVCMCIGTRSGGGEMFCMNKPMASCR